MSSVTPLTAADCTTMAEVREGVDALDRALAMSLDERKERWQALHRNVTLEGIDRWRDSFLAALEHTPRQPQRIQAGVRRTPGLIQAAAGHESLPGSGQRVG